MNCIKNFRFCFEIYRWRSLETPSNYKLLCFDVHNFVSMKYVCAPALGCRMCVKHQQVRGGMSVGLHRAELVHTLQKLQLNLVFLVWMMMMLGGGGDLTCISLHCVFVVCGIFTVATSRLDNF